MTILVFWGTGIVVLSPFAFPTTSDVSSALYFGMPLTWDEISSPSDRDAKQRKLKTHGRKHPQRLIEYTTEKSLRMQFNREIKSLRHRVSKERHLLIGLIIFEYSTRKIKHSIRRMGRTGSLSKSLITLLIDLYSRSCSSGYRARTANVKQRVWAVVYKESQWLISNEPSSILRYCVPRVQQQEK